MSKGKRTCDAAALREQFTNHRRARSCFIINFQHTSGVIWRSMGRINGSFDSVAIGPTDFRRRTDVGRRPIAEWRCTLPTYIYIFPPPNRALRHPVHRDAILFHTMAYRANRVRVYVCTAVTRTSYAHTLHWYTTGKHSSESYLRLPTRNRRFTTHTRTRVYI